MAEESITQMAIELLWITLLLSMPTVVIASLVGLLVSFVQALTQLQDQTLQFLVKLLAVSAVLVVSYSWMGQILFNYMQRILSQIQSISG